MLPTNEILIESLTQEERRESQRRALYLGEGFPVRIRKQNGGELRGETVCLSIGGMAIAVLEKEYRDALVVGEEVELVCEVPGYKPFAVEAKVSNKNTTTQSQKRVIRLGFEYVQEIRGSAPLVESRRSKRMNCTSFFTPNAYAEHPLFFNEHLHFQVAIISRFGMGLVTSARNRAFIVGMPLKLKVLLPMQGEFQVDVKVRNLTNLRTDKDKVLVGVEFENVHKNFLPALAEYLIAFTPTSLEDLRKAEFEIDGIEKGLAFKYVETEQDWQEVLELRFKAYKAVGKFGSAKTAADMTDEYDNYARQLICKNNGKIIACLRIVFVNGDLRRSEHYRLGIKIPEYLGTHFTEASRAATDPEYRGSDVFVNLLRHSGRVTYQAGSRFMIMNCNDNMWKTYQRAGCKKTGVLFDAFGTKGCHLLYKDVIEGFNGFGGGFLGWHIVSYPMAVYLNRRKNRIPFVTKSILLMHRIAKPVVRYFLKRRVKRRTWRQN